MAWEKRGRQLYYIRGCRVAGRVMHTYFGRGEEAILAAALDAQKRARRRAHAEAKQAMLARLTAMEELVREFHDGVAILTGAILLAAGYYRHDRGAWRKRGGYGQTE